MHLNQVMLPPQPAVTALAHLDTPLSPALTPALRQHHHLPAPVNKRSPGNHLLTRPRGKTVFSPSGGQTQIQPLSQAADSSRDTTPSAQSPQLGFALGILPAFQVKFPALFKDITPEILSDAMQKINLAEGVKAIEQAQQVGPPAPTPLEQSAAIFANSTMIPHEDQIVSILGFLAKLGIVIGVPALVWLITTKIAGKIELAIQDTKHRNTFAKAATGLKLILSITALATSYACVGWDFNPLLSGGVVLTGILAGVGYIFNDRIKDFFLFNLFNRKRDYEVGDFIYVKEMEDVAVGVIVEMDSERIVLVEITNPRYGDKLTSLDHTIRGHERILAGLKSFDEVIDWTKPVQTRIHRIPTSDLAKHVVEYNHLKTSKGDLDRLKSILNAAALETKNRRAQADKPTASTGTVAPSPGSTPDKDTHTISYATITLQGTEPVVTKVSADFFG
ncbi:MAG: hypothetical protein HQM16_15680 [Deltaproteobacteria bacterium]|nr:hypothetical protein [Deltaproteobacteria bacterium]